MPYNFDAIFNAFHREAVDFLLPYTTQWDRRSWWYSQYSLIVLSAAFYNRHRLQFNALRTGIPYILYSQPYILHPKPWTSGAHPPHSTKQKQAAKPSKKSITCDLSSKTDTRGREKHQRSHH